MDIPSTLAGRLHRLHEAQERTETENLLAAGIGPRMGVSTRDWPNGPWSVRSAEAPRHAPGNQVMGLTADHLDALPELGAWFDEVGAHLHLRWPAAEVRSVSERFAAEGLIAHEVEAWMAAPLDGLDVRAAVHDIRLVGSPSHLQDWITAFWGGWAIVDPAMREVAAGAMGPWPGPARWRRYVAYVAGEPAGEALLVLFDDAAYLAEASTVPRFRRQGIQRALIARRLADARREGASVVFGGVEYGDASWSNMRAMGLREASVTVTFRRPPRDSG
ncbi:MAG: GNAT family N-acetyltransferase [Myxococcota bacterium]